MRLYGSQSAVDRTCVLMQTFLDGRYECLRRRGDFDDTWKSLGCRHGRAHYRFSRSEVFVTFERIAVASNIVQRKRHEADIHALKVAGEIFISLGPKNMDVRKCLEGSRIKPEPDVPDQHDSPGWMGTSNGLQQFNVHFPWVYSPHVAHYRLPQTRKVRRDLRSIMECPAKVFYISSAVNLERIGVECSQGVG